MCSGQLRSFAVGGAIAWDTDLPDAPANMLPVRVHAGCRQIQSPGYQAEIPTIPTPTSRTLPPFGTTQHGLNNMLFVILREHTPVHSLFVGCYLHMDACGRASLVLTGRLAGTDSRSLHASNANISVIKKMSLKQLMVMQL